MDAGDWLCIGIFVVLPLASMLLKHRERMRRIDEGEQLDDEDYEP